MGMLGCLLCIVGSTMIVLHAPEERSLSSVEEIWELAIQPGMLLSVVNFHGDVFPPHPPLLILILSLSYLFFHPAFLLYTASVVAVALVLILYCAPRYGPTNIMVYIGICSVIGSLTVSYYTLQLTACYF